jgi:hypothetical protein
MVESHLVKANKRRKKEERKDHNNSTNHLEWMLLGYLN